MNSTNDPALRSWLAVPADSDFPIQNLPFGVFRRRAGGSPRVGVAIGDSVLDLAVLEANRLFDGPQLRQRRVFEAPSLNAFLALGRAAWAEARASVSRLLRHDEPAVRDE